MKKMGASIYKNMDSILSRVDKILYRGNEGNARPFFVPKVDDEGVVWMGAHQVEYDILDLRWCFHDSLINYEIQFSEHCQYYYTEDMDPSEPLEFFWEKQPVI